MSFEVTDLRATVEALRARGVIFEEYELPGSQDPTSYLLLAWICLKITNIDNGDFVDQNGTRRFWVTFKIKRDENLP